jgi:large subunit ribosomal protein L10
VSTRQDKRREIETCADLFRRAAAAVFTDYRGLKVAEMNDLRRRLRQAGVEYRVVKNTLVQLAAKQTGTPNIDTLAHGPTAVAFSYDDPVAPARVLVAFAKEHKQLQLKGGLVQGALLDQARIHAIATLPSASELRAQVARSFQAPLVSLAVVMAAPMRALVCALEAVRASKAEGKGTAA